MKNIARTTKNISYPILQIFWKFPKNTTYEHEPLLKFPSEYEFMVNIHKK